MKIEDFVGQLEPWRAKHRRPAWKPIVQSEDGPETASKFSGTPWIGEESRWPECSVCEQPSQLFLQLDLDALPTALGSRFGTGLLQLFYCTNEDCQGMGGWDPFADDLSRARVVQPTGPSLETLVPRRSGYFPAKRIVGWQSFSDLPPAAEHGNLGIDYEFENDGTMRLRCAELGLVSDALPQAALAESFTENATVGDKLGGWAFWVQGPEYPNCPRCARSMELVFQIDSEDNVPFMFGDAGCGHVTQCPEHKDVVAFGWACG